MPRELVATAPRTPVLRGYVERPLKPGEVRIRSRLSAEKHGTSLTVYRGEVPGVTFPIALGNMSVGIVAETAVGVTGLKLGDRVYGYLPVRETHVVGEERVSLAPEELHDEELVCIDPAVVALMAVREGRLRLGDNAAVFGTGAIGLFAVQMAKLSGCMLVVAVEPVGKRRRLAERFGADRVVDPTAEDAVSKIKELTDGKGVDVALEVSGQYRVLNQAIKATKRGCMIINSPSKENMTIRVVSNATIDTF